MKRILGVVIAGFMALGLVSCGGSSGASPSSDSLTISSIDQLPKATGAMASSASASIVAPRSVEDGEPAGVNFSSVEEGDFSSGSSMAACEVFSVVKRAFASGTNADMILCCVGELSGSFEGVEGVNPYDGDYHVYSLNLENAEDGVPSKVKMKISKDANNNINFFEMFACNSSNEQIEYVKQEIDYTIGKVEMESRGIHPSPDGLWAGTDSVVMEGYLNASGAYTSRTITVSNVGQSLTGELHTNESSGELIQDTDNPEFIFSGFQNGTFEGGSYATQAYAAGNLINDDSSDLSELAMGDGAVQVEMHNVYDGEDWTPEVNPFIDAWQGEIVSDILAPAVDPASDSGFYNAASSGEYPDIEDVTAVSFTEGADDYWDCLDEADGTVSGDQEVISAECEVINNNWINCYNAIYGE